MKSKKQKQTEAGYRQARRDQLKAQDQINVLKNRPGNSKKEIERLMRVEAK